MVKKLKEPANVDAAPSDNDGRSETQRFEDLARRLVRVPKKEINEKGRRKSA